MVGAPRFELGTSWSRTKRATRLRYAPTVMWKRGQRSPGFAARVSYSSTSSLQPGPASSVPLRRFVGRRGPAQIQRLRQLQFKGRAGPQDDGATARGRASPVLPRPRPRRSPTDRSPRRARSPKAPGLPRRAPRGDAARAACEVAAPPDIRYLCSLSSASRRAPARRPATPARPGRRRCSLR